MPTAMNTQLPRILSLLVLVTLLATGTQAAGPKITWDLDDAMRQVDRQADDFKSALARVNVTRSDINGDELSSESGTLFINRDGKIRIDMDAPQQRTYLLDRKYLYIHFPDREVVEQYYLSRHKNRLEPFLRLGFSTTGRDLKDDFLLTSMGERDIGDSRTLGLDLTPEKDKTREVVGGIKLWIDQASWMPTQQVINATGSGETLRITYTQVARNLQLNPDLFKARWPRGTDKQKM